jgi:hypothetical protein
MLDPVNEDAEAFVAALPLTPHVRTRPARLLWLVSHEVMRTMDDGGAVRRAEVNDRAAGIVFHGMLAYPDAGDAPQPS